MSDCPFQRNGCQLTGCRLWDLNTGQCSFLSAYQVIREARLDSVNLRAVIGEFALSNSRVADALEKIAEILDSGLYIEGGK